MTSFCDLFVMEKFGPSLVVLVHFTSIMRSEPFASHGFVNEPGPVDFSGQSCGGSTGSADALALGVAAALDAALALGAAVAADALAAVVSVFFSSSLQPATSPTRASAANTVARWIMRASYALAPRACMLMRMRGNRGEGRARRAVTVVAMAASAAAAFDAALAGCDGDDVRPDASVEAGADVGKDQGAADVPADVHNDFFDVQPQPSLRYQVAQAFCTRLASCCGFADAGLDTKRCISDVEAQGGYLGLVAGLNTPGIDQRGHVSLNAMNTTTCLAALSTISCPILTAAEAKNLLTSCAAMLRGTQALGGDCVDSIECADAGWCDFAADAGTSDAGAPLGRCAAARDAGASCGQGAYGPPAFASDECARKGGAAFCAYDSYPDAAGYACAPLRGAGAAGCRSDFECASAICAVPDASGAPCPSGGCSCATTYSFADRYCPRWPLDAGAD